MIFAQSMEAMSMAPSKGSEGVEVPAAGRIFTHSQGKKPVHIVATCYIMLQHVCDSLWMFRVSRNQLQYQLTCAVVIALQKIKAQVQ